MESSLLIPITVWNSSQPTFRVSSIRITPNGSKLITSSLDGELSIWDLNFGNFDLKPRNLLIGHSDPVTCLECTDDYAISTSEGGEICRWNLNDGYCSKSIKSVFVHRKIQLFKCSTLEDDLLFTCGDYHEIFIIHSVILHTVLVLHSKSDSDWISCFHVMSSLEIGNDVVSAVTRSSHIKLWIIEEISDNFSYEVQSSLLPVKNVSHIKCSLTQTQLLVICDKSWTIFDAKYLKTICSANRVDKEKFLGGDFLDSEVLIWTNDCRFYLFKLGVDGATLRMVFSNSVERPNIFDPAMCFHVSDKGKYLLLCDVCSNLTLWKVDGSESNVMPCLKSDLGKKFSEVNRNIHDHMKEVTCCIIISSQDLFVVGCSDGTIMIDSALQTFLSYTDTKFQDSDCKTLLGHKGRVNCLLYPHDKYAYHNRAYLLSGGSDFSVCLWDITTYRLIHKFCVQSGEIIKLLVPPEDCKARVRNSVCSVADDHSVAILNLKELKCIVLASRQLFPVVTINWRPRDDFIIIECFDGTVYIWEMETGHLDRVLDGVTAQEVIYACRESNHEDVSNFCLREDALVGKDHFRRRPYQIEKDFHGLWKSCPVIVRGFLDNYHSENQIIAFNVDVILESLDSRCVRNQAFDPEAYHRAQVLTNPNAPKTIKRRIKLEEEINGESRTPWKKLSRLLLRMLHERRKEGSKPGNQLVPIQYGVISGSQNVSIFLSNSVRTPLLNTINTVLLTALDERVEKGECELDLEILARLWQSKSATVRKTARKLLLSKLHSQSLQERSLLLQRWFKYLPHFASIDGTRINKSDNEVRDLRITALVLFGVIGSDFKFKTDNPPLEETYTQETSSAILHCLQDADPQNGEVHAIATHILGRGYAIWEQYVKFEKVFHVLFDITSEYDRHEEGSSEYEKCVNAHEALISIAVARTEGFMSCVTREITQVRNSQSPKSENVFMEKSRTEIILVLTNLLERTPYIMLQHLNDVVTAFTYCVNAGHFKTEVIGNLLPVLDRFKQVHQCLATQRIAVGLHDGGVVIHELKTSKTHRFAAHGDAVNAVMFSPDGKILATYSYFENKLSFWHVFAGIFGLGHVHVKCFKSYDTNRIGDECVRNHLEIGELSWLDNKSVNLQLCDGSLAVYHA